MAQNITLSALYLTDFDMLASMSFLLQFIALAQSLKTLAGSLSVVCRPTPPQSPSPHSFAVSALLPLFRGARVDETTPKCARPAVGMKLVLRAPLLVMSAETVYRVLKQNAARKREGN